MLLLLSIFVLVLTYLLYTIFYAEQSLFYMLCSKFLYIFLRCYTFTLFFIIVLLIYDFYLTDLWNNYLPFLYSCISFIGVLMLLSNYNCCYIKLTINKIKPKIVLLHFNNNNFTVICSSTKYILNVLLKFVFVHIKFLSFLFFV